MDAVLLGPGLGRSEELKRLVQALLSICRVPLVLDADGINAVAAHIDVLRGCACPVVLTPHDGEFLRLGGDPKAADRTQEAMRLANRTHAVLLLKGSRTVITDGLNIYVNHTGTVSYTHLDVYKRQLQYNASRHQKASAVFPPVR